MPTLKRLTTSDNLPRVVIEPTEGSRFTIISPNWADRTTWYENATRTVEALSSSDNQVWVTLTASHRVDVMHGKITGERNIRSTYAPVVLVDGVQKTENSPESQDGDYSYDYLSGTVTFNSALGGEPVVEVSSSVVSGSVFTIVPDVGKKIRLSEVEVQFSNDIGLEDTVLFQLHIGGAPYGNPVVYQTMRDYINEANVSYPLINAVGGSNWRALKDDVYIYRWDYKASTDLKDSLAMKITISLENHQEFSGSFATATFYGLSFDE